MRVADFIFKFLRQSDIDHVFCLPGGGAMHLNDALYKSGIKNTICLHEQSVAISAEYWGRVENNKFGVAIVTNGPGATNTLTSVAGAFIESVPLLIISGQVKTSDYKIKKDVRQTGVQEVATLSMVKPITKYRKVVQNPDEIKSIMQEAISVMLSGRKGPARIEVPLDIQGAEYIDENQIEKKLPIELNKNKSFKSCKFDDWAPKISSKKRIILLVGQGVRLDGAVEKLNKFATNNQIVVSCTFPGKDCFPYENPLFIGHPGTVAKRSANIAIQNCDLLISIGCSLNNIITAYNSFDFARNAIKIIFDIDENELSKALPPNSLKIKSSADEAINELQKAFEKFGSRYKETCSEWLSYCRDLKKRFSFEHDDAFKSNNLSKEENKLSIYELMDGLSSLLKAFKYIVTGSSGFCIEAFYVLYKNCPNQRILIDSGLGSMGFGLPAVIGVSNATNEKVILIEGDGSLQMNIQELSTIKGNNLNVILIIVNNDGYCSIRNTQDGYFEGRRIGSDTESGLFIPDLHKISKAYSIPFYKCQNITEIQRALNSEEKTEGPSIIEISTFRDEKLQPKVSSRPTKQGTMVTMPIEDMTPLLPLSELDYWMRYTPLNNKSKEARK